MMIWQKPEQYSSLSVSIYFIIFFHLWFRYGVSFKFDWHFYHCIFSLIFLTFFLSSFTSIKLENSMNFTEWFHIEIERNQFKANLWKLYKIFMHKKISLTANEFEWVEISGADFSGIYFSWFRYVFDVTILRTRLKAQALKKKII